MASGVRVSMELAQPRRKIASAEATARAHDSTATAEDTSQRIKYAIFEVFYHLQHAKAGKSFHGTTYVAVPLLALNLLGLALPSAILQDGWLSPVATALSMTMARFSEHGLANLQIIATVLLIVWPIVMVILAAIIWGALATPAHVLVSAAAGDYKKAAGHPGLAKAHKNVPTSAVRILRTMVELTSTGLFVPLIGSGLGMFRCSHDEIGDCWSAGKVVVAIFGVVAMLAVAVIAVLSAQLHYPRTTRIHVRDGRSQGSELPHLTRPSPKAHLTLLACLAVATLLQTLDFLTNEFIVVVGTIACLAALYREVYLELPFVDMANNRYTAALLGASIWCATMTFFVAVARATFMVELSPAEPYIAGEWCTVLGVLPFAYVAVAIIEKRWDSIDNWKEFATPAHIELRVRRLLALATHEEARIRMGRISPAILVARLQGAAHAMQQQSRDTRPSSRGPEAERPGVGGDAGLPSGLSRRRTAQQAHEHPATADLAVPSVMDVALDEAEEILADALESQGSTAMMHIFCARFMLAEKGNRHVAQSHFRAVYARSDATISHLFEAYQQQRVQLEEHLAASSAKGTLSITARVGFERHKQEARDHEISARSAIADFWSELLVSHASGERLSALSSRIRVSMRKAELAYKALLRLNSRSVTAMRQYAQFLLEVSNDSKRGMQLIGEADAVEEEALEAKARQEDIAFELMAKSPEELDTTAEDVGVLTASSNPSSLGVITDANSAAVAMWGYSKREMIGSNLSMLMPEPISGMHDMLLRKYMASGQSSVMDVPRMAVMLHKQGYLIPSALMIRNLGEEGFGGVIRPLQVKEHLIVCTAPNGIITGVCQRSMEALGLRADRIRKGEMNILRHLPQLSKIVRHLTGRPKLFEPREESVHRNRGFHKGVGTPKQVYTPSSGASGAAGFSRKQSYGSMTGIESPLEAFEDEADLTAEAAFDPGPTESSVITNLKKVQRRFLQSLTQTRASAMIGVDVHGRSMQVVMEVQVTKYVAPPDMPAPGRAVLIKWWELTKDDQGSQFTTGSSVKSGTVDPSRLAQIMASTNLPSQPSGADGTSSKPSSFRPARVEPQPQHGDLKSAMRVGDSPVPRTVPRERRRSEARARAPAPPPSRPVAQHRPLGRVSINSKPQLLQSGLFSADGQPIEGKLEPGVTAPGLVGQENLDGIVSADSSVVSEDRRRRGSIANSQAGEEAPTKEAEQPATGLPRPSPREVMRAGSNSASGAGSDSSPIAEATATTTGAAAPSLIAERDAEDEEAAGAEEGSAEGAEAGGDGQQAANHEEEGEEGAEAAVPRGGESATQGGSADDAPPAVQPLEVPSAVEAVDEPSTVEPAAGGSLLPGAAGVGDANSDSGSVGQAAGGDAARLLHSDSEGSAGSHRAEERDGAAAAARGVAFAPLDDHAAGQREAPAEDDHAEDAALTPNAPAPVAPAGEPAGSEGRSSSGGDRESSMLAAPTEPGPPARHPAGPGSNPSRPLATVRGAAPPRVSALKRIDSNEAAMESDDEDDSSDASGSPKGKAFDAVARGLQGQPQKSSFVARSVASSSKNSRLTASTVLRRAITFQSLIGMEPSLRRLQLAFMGIVLLVTALNAAALLASRTVLSAYWEDRHIAGRSIVRQQLAQQVYSLTSSLHVMSQTGAGDAADWTVVAAQLERTVDELEAVHRALYLEVRGSGIDSAASAYSERGAVEMFQLVDAGQEAVGDLDEILAMPPWLGANPDARFVPHILVNGSVDQLPLGLLDAGVMFAAKARTAARTARSQWRRHDAGRLLSAPWFVLANGPSTVFAALDQATQLVVQHSLARSSFSSQWHTMMLAVALCTLAGALVLVVLPIVLRIAHEKNKLFRLFASVPRIVIKHLRARTTNKLRRLQLEKEAEESGGADELAELAEKLAMEALAFENIDWSAITFRETQKAGAKGGGVRNAGCCGACMSRASGKRQVRVTPSGQREAMTFQTVYVPSWREFFKAGLVFTLPLVCFAVYYLGIFLWDVRTNQAALEMAASEAAAGRRLVVAHQLYAVAHAGVHTDDLAEADHSLAVLGNLTTTLLTLADEVAFGSAGGGSLSSTAQGDLFLSDACLASGYDVMPIASTALQGSGATGTALDTEAIDVNVDAAARRQLLADGTGELLPYTEANAGDTTATPLPAFYANGRITHEQCQLFLNGLLRSGLQASLTEFARLSQQMVASRVAQLNPLASSAATSLAGPGVGPVEANARLASPSVQTLRLLSEVLLQDALEESVALHQASVDQYVRQYFGWTTGVAVVATLALALVFILVIRPTLQSLDSSIKHTRAMMLLLPDEVVRGVPSISSMVTEFANANSGAGQASLLDVDMMAANGEGALDDDEEE